VCAAAQLVGERRFLLPGIMNDTEICDLFVDLVPEPFLGQIEREREDAH
jgi:hypothetical protein